MSTAQGWPLIALMFNAPLIGVRKRWPNVLHAVEMDGLPIKTWPNGKATSACGLTGLRVAADGNSLGLWPPRVAGLPPQLSRCPACVKAASKKRPRSEWRQNDEAPAKRGV